MHGCLSRALAITLLLVAQASGKVVPGLGKHPAFEILEQPVNFTDAIRACAATQLLNGTAVLASVGRILDSLWVDVLQGEYVWVLRDLFTPVGCSSIASLVQATSLALRLRTAAGHTLMAI